MFKNMMTDEVSLIKSNGERIDHIKALVQTNMIFINDNMLVITEGDRFLRLLPNGVEESYLVTDSGYQSGFGGIKPHYQTKVRKEIRLPDERNNPIQSNMGHTNIQGNVGIEDGDFIGRDQSVLGDNVRGDKHVHYAEPPLIGIDSFSKDALKLLLTMVEIFRRDGVRSIQCIEMRSNNFVGRWNYQIQGAPENETLFAEDILGGTMDELLESDLVRRTGKISYLLQPRAITLAKNELLKQKRRKFIEVVVDLQAGNHGSYIPADAIAKKLILDLEETIYYLELMAADEYFKTVKTLGAISVRPLSRGHMLLKDSDFE